MTKYLIDLWLDGYETDAEREPAQREWIEEQLNFTASSVKLLDLTQLEADAKLGRMVRKLPSKMSLFRRDNIWRVEGWTGKEIFEGEWINASGDTPEAALEAVGIKDD